MTKGSIPVDDNFKPVLALYDDVTGNIIPAHIGAIVTGSDGNKYAKLDVDVTVAASLAGNLTNNNAAPGTTNVGALTGIANASAPTYTEGDQVLSSLDLAGSTRVKVTNANANGQNTMANSAPVVIASDQSSVKVKRNTVAAYSLASTATTSSSNSGDIDTSAYTEISIDINTTAKTGTTPTIQFIYARKAADGLYYDIWQSATITNVAANTISTSIGAGMAYNQSLGATGQLRWVIGGSATPGYTFSANIQGK